MKRMKRSSLFEAMYIDIANDCRYILYISSTNICSGCRDSKVARRTKHDPNKKMDGMDSMGRKTRKMKSDSWDIVVVMVVVVTVRCSEGHHTMRTKK